MKFQKQQGTGIIKYKGLPGIGVVYHSVFCFFFLSTFNKDLALAEHWVKHLANLFQSTLTRSLKTGAIFKALLTSEERKPSGVGSVGWYGWAQQVPQGHRWALTRTSLLAMLNLSCHDIILILLFIGQDGEEEAGRGNSRLKMRWSSALILPTCSPSHLGSQLPRLRLCRGGCDSASLPQFRPQAH